MSTNASSLTSTSSDSADDTGHSTPQTQGDHQGDLPVQASSHCSVTCFVSYTLCPLCSRFLDTSSRSAVRGCVCACEYRACAHLGSITRAGGITHLCNITHGDHYSLGIITHLGAITYLGNITTLGTITLSGITTRLGTITHTGDSHSLWDYHYPLWVAVIVFTPAVEETPHLQVCLPINLLIDFV